MKQNILFIAILLLLSSCSTIHYRFENEPNGQGKKTWYHLGVFDFVEYSDPVRIKNFCDKGVHSITSRRNPVQAILKAVPWLRWVWSAREVKMECSDTSLAVNKMEKAKQSGSESSNINNNNNNININITPDMLKKKADN